MRIDFLTEWRDQLERLTTEELLQWTHEMDYFASEPFVWDTCGGLDLGKSLLAETDRSRKGPDELFSNLSRNDTPPLFGDRRRRGGRA